MTQIETPDAEKEALLCEKTKFYGSNDDENDDYTEINKSPSLADALANKRNVKRKPSRLEWAQASWIRWPHLLFWWWLNPTLRLGNNQTLTDDDLEDLPHEDKCSVLLQKLLTYDWSTTTTWRIVLNVFGKQTFYIGLVLLLQIAARITQPLFLRAIVHQVTDKDKAFYHLIIGIMLAVGLFLVTILQSFTNLHVLFHSTRLGIRIRNALSSSIYRHLLSINMSSLQQTTSAEAINLVANDTSRFEDLWVYVHYLWAAPLEVIISFGLLAWIIGPAPATFAFILLLLFIPIEFILGRRFGVWHQKTMSCTDKRIKAYSEILDGCHIIKMYNWEKSMEERVRNMRNDELRSMSGTNQLRSINTNLYFILPCLMALPAFCAIWLFGTALNPADIFTALTFFGQIRLPLVKYMPLAIQRVSAMFAASRRIDEFMRLKKTQSQTSNDQNENKKPGTIIMRDASFSWRDNHPCLSSLNVDFQSNQLVGIVGSVGSGKSSLLADILGEMNLINGNIQVNGTLSYAVQSTWIFADTVRANILLGRKLDEERYTRVIRACCLDMDLKSFGQAGDLTMIGEKGVNLSGGQKGRISLARALYIDADIYLLDDPLSAVDSRVAKTIFDNCIGPQALLREKTRVLITHQTHFLSSSDQCILLADGCIKKSGPFDQLSIGHELEDIESADAQTTKQADDTQESTADELDWSRSTVDNKPILSDETEMSSDYSWSVCYTLFTSTRLGRCGLVLLIIILIVAEICSDATTYWLAIWSEQSYTEQQDVNSYFYVYLGLTLATISIALVRGRCWFYTMMHGATTEHNRMLRSILYTSLRFFESNPVGRIHNRASRDQYLIDQLLPATMFDAVQSMLLLVGSLVIIVSVNPLVFILLVIVLPLFWYLRRYFTRTNGQLKRLEGITRSAIYSLFPSSLNGLTTIRVFKVNDDFVQTFNDRVDANTRSYLPLIGAAYWYGLRLNFIASCFVLMTALLAIAESSVIKPALVALTLRCTIDLVDRLQWTMQQVTASEDLLVSAQRIDEYARLPPEEDNGGKAGIVEISSDWPNNGTIEFRNYTMRYRPELEPVLNNLNLYINSNEKIGIIGRTGSGKSSLFQALLRLVGRSTADGEILIDDIDISHLTLNHLRSQLSVIPQKPILFSGTLRYNLDPFEIYTDEDCLNALEDVQLKHRICNHPDGLYVTVAESGSNFSVGECQLICVARAILKKTKILLIDEATANVDQQTDALIQAVIREKFRDRTILTIAHRFDTIDKSDRILVMHRGQAVSFDTPKNILQ